jgi:hypothetical protein
MRDLLNRPSGPTDTYQEFPFLVWQQRSASRPDQKLWACIAGFRFFSDCEAFVKGIAEKGEECLFQTPLRSKLVKPQKSQVMTKTKKKYKEETIKQSTARKNRNIAALLKETYKGGPSVHPLDMKITDLLVDLRHFCDIKKINFREALMEADTHYNAETQATSPGRQILPLGAS